MNLLPMVFASGFASGINAYLTVLVLGLCGRFLHTGGVPTGFERTDVLVVMGALALLEIVADKIPYLDSIWDTISTFIRPVAGALIGALIAGAHGDLPTIALASVGGVTALLTTLQKTSVRMAINTTPEPASNAAHSVINDLVAFGVSVLACVSPVAAMVIAAALLIVGVALAIVLFKRIRRGWRRVRAWFARGTEATPVSRGATAAQPSTPIYRPKDA